MMVWYKHLCQEKTLCINYKNLKIVNNQCISHLKIPAPYFLIYSV